MQLSATPLKIINLTQHVINVLDTQSGEMVAIPPSGVEARLTNSREIISQVKTEYGVFNITKTVFGEVQNLPDYDGQSIFIVSSLIAQAVPERMDIFIPDDTFRNDKGQIVGCRSIATLAKNYDEIQ